MAKHLFSDLPDRDDAHLVRTLATRAHTTRERLRRLEADLAEAREAATTAERRLRKALARYFALDAPPDGSWTLIGGEESDPHGGMGATRHAWLGVEVTDVRSS